MLSLIDRVDGQDLVEYAIMLAVVLTFLVLGFRLLGVNLNQIFSSVAGGIH